MKELQIGDWVWLEIPVGEFGTLEFQGRVAEIVSLPESKFDSKSAIIRVTEDVGVHFARLAISPSELEWIGPNTWGVK